MGCLLFFIVLFQHWMSSVADLEMCAFIFASAVSKREKKTKWVHASSDHLRVMRSCALVRLEGDAAALKARQLRVWQVVMLSKRKREVAAAEFFDFRLLQSRHGDEACLLGTLSLNLAEHSAQNLSQKQLHQTKKNCKMEKMNIKTKTENKKTALQKTF